MEQCSRYKVHKSMAKRMEITLCLFKRQSVTKNIHKQIRANKFSSRSFQMKIATTLCFISGLETHFLCVVVARELFIELKLFRTRRGGVGHMRHFVPRQGH